MGAGDSKLTFKKGVFRLAEEHNIPGNDPYWLSFWELPESAADVFTLFSSADIRRTRDNHLENLETLILAVTSRLFALKHHPSFPHPEVAPERDALNCIRILTRLLPFIYEKESLEEWERGFFWGTRRKRTRRNSLAKSEIIFDETTADQQEIAQPPVNEDEFETAAPLMEELVDTCVDLLFYIGFTLPAQSGQKDGPKFTYGIWQSGVGCNTTVPTTKELESNRIETLRLLLSITSKSMFTPAHILPVKGVRALTYMVTSSEKRVVLSLLCSLLNTTLKYNPASWRVPYDHIVFSDPRQVLVTYSLQLLLVLLLYPIPEGPINEMSLKNNYRHYLGRLHRTPDFQFMVDGMTRILSQPMQVHTSYLPGSQKPLKWAPEMIMLFWESLQVNKRFRSFIIDTDRAYDFVVLILYYAMEHRLDPSKSGVVRMCIFVLQTLSAEPKFGKSLNKKFEAQNTLPQSMRIAAFNGTFADYLVISIYNLITASKGKLAAVYPALLATVANTAPHIKNLSGAASSKLIQLFASMSAPQFLLANESNNQLLASILESMNAIIEHQYPDNAAFIYTLLRSSKRFLALRDFTLEPGNEEADRQTGIQKNGRSETPKVSLEGSTRTPIRSPSSTAEEPMSPGTFAIGDDEDDEEEDESDDKSRIVNEQQKKNQDTPVSSTTSQAPSPNRLSTEEDVMPHQLRGMSEKARGKMPMRQSSTNSISSPNTTSSGTQTPRPNCGFEPTKTWLESWLPHLPLHTILTLIQELGPMISDLLKKSNTQGSDPNAHGTVLNFIKTQTSLSALGIETTDVKVHLFEWSTPALGWYESLLWGFIFVSEVDVSKGTVGVWNGTTVKLFKVQEMQQEGPSLLAPKGAVDAIGSTLVERLGSVSIGRGSAGVTSNHNSTSHNTMVNVGGQEHGIEARRSPEQMGNA